MHERYDDTVMGDSTIGKRVNEDDRWSSLGPEKLSGLSGLSFRILDE